MDDSIKYALREFLNNRKENFKEDEILVEPFGQDSPIDAVYKKTNEKFQIKRAPKDEVAIVGILDKKDKVHKGNFDGEWIDAEGIKIKGWNGGGNPIELFIKQPLKDIIKQYGPNNKCLNDIICILHISEGVSPGFFPNINSLEILNQTGFKEIYLVDHKNNFKIY